MSGLFKDNGLDNALILAEIGNSIKETNRLARENFDYRMLDNAGVTASGTSFSCAGGVTGTVLRYTHNGAFVTNTSTAGTKLYWTGTSIAPYTVNKGFFNKAVLMLNAAGAGTITVGAQAPIAALVTIAEPTDTPAATIVNDGTIAFIGSTTAVGTLVTATDVMGGHDSAAIPTVSPAGFNTPSLWTATTVKSVGDYVMPSLEYTGTVTGTAQCFKCIASTGTFKTGSTTSVFVTGGTAITDGSVTWLQDTTPHSNVKLARDVTYSIGGKTYTKTGPVFNFWNMTGFNVKDGNTAKFLLCIDANGKGVVRGCNSQNITLNSSNTTGYGAPAWSGTATYSIKDVVVSNNYYFYSKKDTNLNHQPETSNGYWAPMEGDMPETLNNVAVVACLQIAPSGTDYIGGTTSLAAANVNASFIDIRRLAPVTL